MTCRRGFKTFRVPQQSSFNVVCVFIYTNAIYWFYIWLFFFTFPKNSQMHIFYLKWYIEENKVERRFLKFKTTTSSNYLNTFFNKTFFKACPLLNLHFKNNAYNLLRPCIIMLQMLVLVFRLVVLIQKKYILFYF